MSTYYVHAGSARHAGTHTQSHTRTPSHIDFYNHKM